MKEYVAKKVNSPLTVNDARWESIEKVLLDSVWLHRMPSPYTTYAQLAHSDDGITVRLSTNEWPLTITAMKHNESVCIDSCMEFFFTPNMDDADYINLEMNPAGICLVCIGPGRGGREKLEFKDEIKVESLITPECGWTIMAHIPYSFLNKYYSHCDKTMKGNFYKCGNNTVIPHYSTWNKVETPMPDYHRPEYFGKIILAD